MGKFLFFGVALCLYETDTKEEPNYQGQTYFFQRVSFKNGLTIRTP